MLHSSAQKISSTGSTTSPVMRALHVLHRRRWLTTVTTSAINHTRNSRSNRLQIHGSVFAPRCFHTPTASLLSSSSSPFYSSSSSSASLSHSRSTTSSSSNSPYWQKNLLLLGGAGLISSSYLTNHSEKEHSVSRCEAEPKMMAPIDPKTQDDPALSTKTDTTTTTKSVQEQPTQEEDPEDDEETHCTICLINRQGPCRPYWRKFERCMKDHSKSKDEDDAKTNSTESSSPSPPPPSMGDKCDGYMMPWITCIQSHRNTYTLISNKFFQDEFVDGVEKGISEEDKICLGDEDGDGGDGATSSPSLDWRQFVEFQNDGWPEEIEEEAVVGVDTDKREDMNSGDQPAGVPGEGDADANLVEGVARINLWDGDGTRRVDLAYVRDQDGLLLGHERFTVKANESAEGEGGATGEKEEKVGDDDNKNDGTSSENTQSKPTIGHCTFHVSPGLTKSIQIFALYGKDGADNYGSDSGDEKSSLEDKKEKNADSGTAIKDEDKNRGKQTLYYSRLIPLDDLKPPSRIKEPGSATINDGIQGVEKSHNVDT